VLADDHVLFRQGLKALLLQAGFAVVGEASDGRCAVQLCEQERPATAILDCAMPLLNGVDAAREIRHASPGTRVVLLSMYAESAYVLAGLRAGASAYVLKSAAASDLLQAIDAVANGGIYLSPAVSRTVVDAYLAGTQLPADPLSGREREVLQLIAEGRGVKEIGELLGISARTAETHRARIMGKLEIHDVAGLVRYALKHGLARDDRA
jgi:DNA-binding NarL/FixJ family response regulator